MYSKQLEKKQNNRKTVSADEKEKEKKENTAKKMETVETASTYMDTDSSAAKSISEGTYQGNNNNVARAKSTCSIISETKAAIKSLQTQAKFSSADSPFQKASFSTTWIVSNSISIPILTVFESKTCTDTKKVQVFLPSEYYKYISDGAPGNTLIDQLLLLARTPALVSLVALPDVHAGKVFPVGISCSYNIYDPACTIFPDLIGFDINCGVRVWATQIKKAEFLAQRDVVLDLVTSRIPIESREVVTSAHSSIVDGVGSVCIDRILNEGLLYLKSIGVADQNDLACTEYNGSMRLSTTSAEAITKCTVLGQKPKSKGLQHLSTLGGGNHYLEFQVVSDVFNAKVCQQLGLKPDTVCVSVHTGSRGVGSRAVHEFMNKIGSVGAPEEGSGINNVKGVPINSVLANEYLDIVSACSNYAFCNRLLIGKAVNEILSEVFIGTSVNMRCISDSVHNVMHIEDSALIVRKGSTKMSFSNGPVSVVSVGGSMSTGSYILQAGPNSSITGKATCHGSGRIIRRKDASKAIPISDIDKELSDVNVKVSSGNRNALSEESCKVYKCIDKLVTYCETIGISRKVCKLIPLAVLKG